MLKKKEKLTNIIISISFSFFKINEFRTAVKSRLSKKGIKIGNFEKKKERDKAIKNDEIKVTI